MVRTSRPPPSFPSTRPPGHAPRALLAWLREVPLDEPEEAELEQRRKRIIPRLRQAIRAVPTPSMRLTH